MKGYHGERIISKSFGKSWTAVFDKEENKVYISYRGQLFNEYTFPKFCLAFSFFNRLKTITDAKFSNIIKNQYLS